MKDINLLEDPFEQDTPSVFVIEEDNNAPKQLAIELVISKTQNQLSDAEVEKKRVEQQLAILEQVIDNTNRDIGNYELAQSKLDDLRFLVQQFLSSVCCMFDKEVIAQMGEEFNQIALDIVNNYDTHKLDEHSFFDSIGKVIQRQEQREKQKNNKSTKGNILAPEKINQTFLITPEIIDLRKYDPDQSVDADTICQIIIQQNDPDTFALHLRNRLKLGGNARKADSICEQIKANNLFLKAGYFLQMEQLILAEIQLETQSKF